MNENLVFYQLSEESSTRILQQIEKFNEDRSDHKGVYGISLATELRPYYILWRIFPSQEFVPVRTLAITFELSVERAMRLLKYCDVKLKVFNSDFFNSYYSTGTEFIPFGKYRQKRLAEVLYVEPSYILWLANRFKASNPRHERLHKEAQKYAQVYYELMMKQQRLLTSQNEFVGKKGDRLKDYYVRVINIKLQADNYKPDFYVDQNVLALDEKGNRVTFFVKAGGKSLTPNQLSCHSRVIQRKETLHILSAKVMRQYVYHGVKYTHLGWVKLDF